MLRLMLRLTRLDVDITRLDVEINRKKSTKNVAKLASCQCFTCVMLASVRFDALKHSQSVAIF